MRSLVIWLLLAVAAAEFAQEPWVEEEDVDEPYDVEEEEVVYRRRRDVHDEGPYDEHIRVKRCCEEPQRYKRSADYVRVPRQVHQYEVHEFNEDAEPSSPPYEEMLAAASDHYHRVYASPGAPKSARYLDPDVSSTANVVPPTHNAHTNHANSPVSSTSYQAPHKPAQAYQAAAPPAKPYQVVPAKPAQFQAAVPSASKPYQTAPAKPAQLYHATVSSASQTHQAPLKAQSYQAAEAAYRPAQPAPFVNPIHSVSPAQFTHTLPVVSSSYVSLVPAEVPVPVAADPVVTLQQLDADQSPAAGHHHHNKHSHGHSQGGGHAHHGKHYGEHGGKTSKGFNQDHYVDKGGKGHKIDEHHRKEYEEAAGQKKKHHDKAGHKGSHEEQAHGHRGAHFDEKKGHKKGHKTKGYHNKYHKDEFHKEHKFYDDYHKSGEHHRYGKFNAKHASNESGKKKAHHVNAGHDFVERGKKGYSNKGHVDADHKGYDGKKGHEEHNQHHSSHGKKGGKEGGSNWAYAKKN